MVFESAAWGLAWASALLARRTARKSLHEESRTTCPLGSLNLAMPAVDCSPDDHQKFSACSASAAKGFSGSMLSSADQGDVCSQSDGQFGAGAHFCLGWPLYMAEAKALLAIYARHYSLSLVSSSYVLPLVDYICVLPLWAADAPAVH